MQTWILWYIIMTFQFFISKLCRKLYNSCYNLKNSKSCTTHYWVLFISLLPVFIPKFETNLFDLSGSCTYTTFCSSLFILLVSEVLFFCNNRWIIWKFLWIVMNPKKCSKQNCNWNARNLIQGYLIEICLIENEIQGAGTH